jgi:hypothetical protein
MEQKQPTRLALLAVAAIFIAVVQGARAADECLEKPNAPSPQGSHWYYRTDRTNNRQCWYLGSERGKAGTQATAPARAQSAKMSAPPAPPPAQATAAVETATAEVMPAEAAPAEITAGEGNAPEVNSTVTLSKFWAGIPRTPNSRSVSVRDSYAEEQSTEAPHEMGLTGPIMTPTEWSGAVRALASSFFTQFCALLAVVLGLAAIIGRLIFTLSAGRKPIPKSRSARGQLAAATTEEHVIEAFVQAAPNIKDVLEPFSGTAASTEEHVLEPFAHTAPRTEEHMLEPFAGTAASIEERVIEPFARTAASIEERVIEPFIRTAASIEEHVLEPFIHTAASTEEAGMAANWASSPPTDTAAGIESVLQRLLRELEQLRHERASRGFEPRRKAVA